MKKSFRLMPYCKKIATGLLTSVLGLLMVLLMLLFWNENTLQIRTKPLLADSALNSATNRATNRATKINAKERRLCIGFNTAQRTLLLNLDLSERLQLLYTSTGLPA
jgi:hypothetical protein